jgi:fission process protein 1
MAYSSRIKTALVASAKRMPRMFAYSSEVGEAGRPILNKHLIRCFYGLSWIYVVGDVALEGANEYEKSSETENVARAVSKRAIFQTTASMILPAITVHQTVHWTSHLLNKFAQQRFGGNRIIPVVAGLATIPALPFMFDHPVEYGVEWVFDKLWTIKTTK